MKNFLILAAAGIALVSEVAMPAAAASICIQTRDIVKSKPNTLGSVIVFTMRDGKVWRNDLHGRCPGLLFDPFVWVLNNPDQTVCENQQSLRVAGPGGETCVLGKFTDVTPKKG